MLTIKNIFEITVYRIEETFYYSQMSAHIAKVNDGHQPPFARGIFTKKYGGAWRYNEIIGFLRFYRYGGSQIRCEYWKTDAKKKIRTRRKQFLKISDGYCKQSFSIFANNSKLVQTMKSAVEHCETRLAKENLVLDRELFDNTVDFIDWKLLLG